MIMLGMILMFSPLAFALGTAPVVAADWEVVAATSEEAMLLDRDSIHDDEYLKKVWTLQSYKQTAYLGEPTVPHRSRAMLYEIDCHAGKLGYAAWSFQSGELGGGRTVWADVARDVMHFSPDAGSSEESLLARVCAPVVALARGAEPMTNARPSLRVQSNRAKN
jgi:hypothetical protein